MADELATLGKPIATTIFGGLLFAHTEKGVFLWDEPRWRKLVAGKAATPANEATTERHSFTAVTDEEPLRDG